MSDSTHNEGIIQFGGAINVRGGVATGAESTASTVIHEPNPSADPRVLRIVGPQVATPNCIFIGHGHSSVWKDLKDLIGDRLKLQWDEFERDSGVGYAIIDHLTMMLNRAVFAFLVMTAEDEHSDGTKHARENVIHEIGLFQGRLGFKRAVVLLEDGCQGFSDLHGLLHINFPPRDILNQSEAIRKVLEREGLLQGS